MPKSSGVRPSTSTTGLPAWVPSEAGADAPKPSVPPNFSRNPRKARPTPRSYVEKPVVGKPSDGMPVASSTSRAMPSMSMPVMAGTGLPRSAMPHGRISRAAAFTFAKVFASSPITTSMVRSFAHSAVALSRDQRGSS